MQTTLANAQMPFRTIICAVGGNRTRQRPFGNYSLIFVNLVFGNNLYLYTASSI